MARVAASLGEFPSHPFDALPEIVTILFISRSGSSYAGRLLANTPCFSQFSENFATDQLAAIAHIAQRRDLPNLHAAAQWMIDHRGTSRVFGYKAGFTVLASAAHPGFLDQILDRTQFFQLLRRDPVAQVVSLTKAELTSHFHSSQPSKEGRVLPVGARRL